MGDIADDIIDDIIDGYFNHDPANDLLDEAAAWFWTTKQGTTMRLRDMSSSHLLNAYFMLHRKGLAGAPVAGNMLQVLDERGVDMSHYGVSADDLA